MLLMYFLFYGHNARYSLKYILKFLYIFFILFVMKIYNLFSKLDLVLWLASLNFELAM
jgi:hypothetical protein